jgi:hypothetical protein
VCEAFDLTADLVARWTHEHPDSQPPVVVHVFQSDEADDRADGDTLGEHAQRLRTSNTLDGDVLLFNVLLAPASGTYLFAPDSTALLPPLGSRWFERSSELPTSMLERSASLGRERGQGARGFVHGATVDDLRDLLDIATWTLRQVDDTGDAPPRRDRAPTYLPRGAPLERRGLADVGTALSSAIVGFVLTVALVGGVFGCAAVVGGLRERSRPRTEGRRLSLFERPLLAIGLGAVDVVVALAWLILFATKIMADR